MSDLILLIPENIDDPWHWSLSDAQGCAQNDADKLALADFNSTRVIVVLSGVLVVTKVHTLGALSEKQKLQAVGFSIEDELASSLAETHIAFDQKTAHLAVVASSIMTSVLNLLQTVGLVVDVICADYDAVSGDVMFAYGGRVVQPNSDGLGFTVDAKLSSYVFKGGQSLPRDVPAVTVLQKISESFTAGHAPINLRQGVFEKRIRFGGGRVKRLGFLAVACLLVFVGLNIGQGQNYARKNKIAHTEMKQIYSGIFPDIKIPKNPSISVLRAQSDVKGRAGESFVYLSKILAISIKQMEGVDITSLSYDKRREQLALSIVYNSFDDVELLKKIIRNNGGVFTESGTRQDGSRLIGNAILGSVQ